MITRQQIHQLAQFDTGGFPVVSFYLNIDGRVYSPEQDIARAHQLLRDAQKTVGESGLSPEALASVQQDLEKISRYVCSEFDPTGWRGLAIFGCAARQLWQPYLLRVAVEDGVNVESHPHVRPLALIQEDYARYGVVLIDRQKARLFTVDAGEITEHNGIFDDVPTRVHAGTWYGLGDKRIERHIDDHLHRHLKHVIVAVDELALCEGWERMLVYGTQEVLPEFMRILPRRLAQRVVFESSHVTIEAPSETILAQAQEDVTKIERYAEAETVRQLLESASPNGYAVVGLDETLHALYYESAFRLVIDRNLKQAGYACDACGRRFTLEGVCPECHFAVFHRVEDVIEEAIEEALRQGTEIEFVSDLPEWTERGGIGALLRFKVRTG